MEINEEVMRNGFEIYKQSHHRGDVYYDKIFQFYSYMMNHGERVSVYYKLCDQDMDIMEHDGMVLLNGHKLSKSSHDDIVDFYLLADNYWVLRGWFQNTEYVYPKGNNVEFVVFKGVRIRRYQLDEISRQYDGNLVRYFKKFVLGPVRIDRRYTNGSSLYVQIYPEDCVDNELSYWNVISDKAKDELRKSIVDIFTNEEFAHIQVYEAAYEFMEKVGVIDGAQMWISLKQMLRDAARPSVQILGFRLLHHKSLEEKAQLLQGLIQDVEVQNNYPRNCTEILPVYGRCVGTYS